MNKKEIFITGNPESLLPRLPKESEGYQLVWSVCPVLEFISLSVQLPDQFDWIVFASARGVEHWPYSQYAAAGASARVACIGEATAEAARERGWTTHFVPSQPGTETFIREFSTEPTHQSVVLPCAEAGRTALGEFFTDRGWTAHRLPVYRTQSKAIPPRQLSADLERADAVVFTSPSSARAVNETTPVPNGKLVACLGEYTEQFLQKCGYHPWVLPEGDYARVGLLFKESK